MILPNPPATTKVKKLSRKGRKPKKIERPLLDPARVYSRAEAALTLGISTMTIIRARDAGHLSELRTGARCRYLGQQLIDWLQSGGRTS